MRKAFVSALVAAAITTVLASPTIADVLESFLGDTFDATRVSDALVTSGIAAWWASGAFVSCPAGVGAAFGVCLLGYLLAFLFNATSQRAEDGGVLGEAQLRGVGALVRGSSTWNGKSEPAAHGLVYGYR